MFKDYSDEDKKEKPISCIITTLAALAYDGEDNIVDAIISVINNMKRFIETRLNPETGKYVKWISNPVKPTENFADRWALPNSKREEYFNDWIEKLQQDFGIFNSSISRISLAESLKKSFGDAPVTKTFSDIGNNMRALTESGNNNVDRKLGLVGTAVTGLQDVSKVQRHNFFAND